MLLRLATRDSILFGDRWWYFRGHMLWISVDIIANTKADGANVLLYIYLYKLFVVQTHMLNDLYYFAFPYRIIIYGEDTSSPVA